ncbi:MAG TPA: lytic transglycosylase domain-containing protein [Gallionella sp.]
MKQSASIQSLTTVAVILVYELGLLHPAHADIYVYTSKEGTVNLSDVHQDDRYAVLVSEPANNKAVPSPRSIPRKALYDKTVDEVARTYGLDSALLHAVITVESRYKAKAVSRTGAAGLMQLMPLITRHYGVADPFDPVQNLHGGAKHLSYLLKLFNNDISLALAAYNSGETAVAKYGNRIPPYPETVNYVPQVLGFYRKYRAQSL